MAGSYRKKFLAMFTIAIVCFGVGYYAGYTVGYNAGRVTTSVPVRIGHLAADIHQIAFFTAYSEGWYQAEGITPIRMEYLSGPSEMMAFQAGDLDAGYVGVVPALTAKSKGTDLVIVASANLEGSAVVAKKQVGTVMELNGKVVGTPGIGTVQDCMIRMVEKKLSINMNVRHYKFSDLPLLLEKGEVDAYIDWEPFCAEAVVNGFGHIIYTSHEILPNHQCCVFYVSGKLLRENPETARKLIKIHLKSMTFAKEHPDEAKKIFSKMTGKPIGVVDESWKRMIWDHHVNTESMKIFVPYLIEQGSISAKDVPDVNVFVNGLVDEKILADVEAR